MARWLRYGECNRCGECCRGDASWFVDRNPDTTPAMKRTPPVAGFCPAYEVRDGVATCADFAGPPNSFFVKHNCAMFPIDPAQVADCPSCSYQFIRLEA
jgi:hypothetical protein